MDAVPDGLVTMQASEEHTQSLDESLISTEETVLWEQHHPITPNHLIPKLRIVIILVGSHGDVQVRQFHPIEVLYKPNQYSFMFHHLLKPYIGLAKELIEDGHHVRIATHEHHRKFVEANEVEYFKIAGDPAELMEFMVENQLNSVRGFTNKITKHRQ
jgi:hypothetical protein